MISSPCLAVVSSMYRLQHYTKRLKWIGRYQKTYLRMSRGNQLAKNPRARSLAKDIKFFFLSTFFLLGHEAA